MRIFTKTAKKSPNALYKEFLKIVEKVKDGKNPKKRSRMYSYALLAKKNKLTNVEMAYTAFFKTARKSLKLIPGAKTFLQKAKKRYTLCVVTEDEKYLAIQKMRKLHLDRYINVLITSSDTRIMKPSMNYFKLLQKKTRCKLSECIIIGDNYEKDLALPQKKGAFVISFGKQQRLANYSTKDYKELQRFLFLDSA